MHIGINTLFLIPGEVGGSETYLCKTLDAICRNYKTIRITLFTNKENHQFLEAIFGKCEQVTFSNLHFKASNRLMRILREQIELPIKAKKEKVHVLWSPGYTAPFFSPCAQVLTIHDMQYKRHPEDLSPLARLVMDILIKMAAHKVDQFLTISQFSKSEIMRFTSIPKEKIHVTHLAADDIAYKKPTDPELPSIVTKRIPANEKYILTVANSYPHKNLHTLVDAYAKIMDQIPHHLIIVGKPRLGEGLLTQRIEKLQKPDRITRISRLDKNELTAFYQGADLFVFPSLYEGFGLPILEAMMCGVPVITTKKASIPEVGGKSVIYVDAPTAEAFSKKILEVLSWDKACRSDFTIAAKHWAKQFSWEKTAAKTMHFLAHID